MRMPLSGVTSGLSLYLMLWRTGGVTLRWRSDSAVPGALSARVYSNKACLLREDRRRPGITLTDSGDMTAQVGSNCDATVVMPYV